jgi:hypothetical protein
MAVSEEQRRELDQRLRTQLDAETATLLMEVTVPANVDLATRGDVRELRAELLLRITEVDGHLTLEIADLARRISSLEGRLEQQTADLARRINDVEGNLTRRINDVEGNLTRRINDLEGGLAGVGVKLAEVGVKLAEVDVKLAALDVKLTRGIYRVILPTLISVQLVLFVLMGWWLG